MGYMGEILPVPLADKAKMIQVAREHLIPELAARENDTERYLNLFHTLGTLHCPPLDFETALSMEGFISDYSGSEPMPLIEFEETKPGRFTRYDNYVRGGYRILGTFPPNPKMAEYADPAKTYFLGGIPVSTKDYHLPDGPLYYPPVFNLHKLMFTTATNFDSRYEAATSRKDVSQAIADFYFWGLVMIHPYIGANHRAFDRFLEYAFYRKGFDIKTPLDNTLNIPPQTRFNTAMFEERKRLLEMAGLSNPNIPKGNIIHNPVWLSYQNTLNEFVTDGLNGSIAQTGEIADALYSWR
jgi:hypothetical protein